MVQLQAVADSGTPSKLHRTATAMTGTFDHAVSSSFPRASGDRAIGDRRHLCDVTVVILVGTACRVRQSTAESSKFEANLAEVLLGLVMPEGSGDVR
jgi:hypothetical protein